MRSPSDPSALAPGRLRVTGPHIAAELVVFNHRLEPVGKGVGALEPLTLPPGLYDIQATVGGATAYRMVKLEPGKSASISKTDWDAEKLEFSSAAPLTGTSTLHERQSDPAVEWSRQTTWTSSGAATQANSRLFIFVRTLKPEKHQKYFAEGLDLLDCDGRPLTRLAGNAVQAEPDSGWMAFCADLPAGPYLLYRRPGRDIRARYQPLYLCSGWETQVFVPSGRQPSLRKLSLIYAKRGKGFRPDDAQDKAAEAVVSGLRRGLNLATGEQMRSLLEHKLERPWLGVLAAHAMRLPRPDAESEYGAVRDPEAPTYEKGDARLYQVVVERVAGLLGDHPDIRALQLPLSRNAAGVRPFPFPPLLQAGLSLIRQSEPLLGVDLIPAESLTDCVLNRLYTNSVWTGWAPLSRAPRTLDEVTEPAAVGADVAADDAGAAETGELDSLKGKGARRLVKRPASVAQKIQDSILVAEVLAAVALHRVRLLPVSKVINPFDALTVALTVWTLRDQEKEAPGTPEALADFLKDLDAETLCNTYGLPRARALQLVERLRNDGSAYVADLLHRPLGSLLPDEQAVLDVLKRRLASNPLDAAATLDSLIQQIGTAWSQLGGIKGEDWTDSVRDDLLATRRRLARRATLVAVIDMADKRLLYQNPPFAALEASVPGSWRKVRPGKAKTLSTAFEKTEDQVDYRVSRTAVEDEPTGRALGWIYHATPSESPWELEALAAQQKHVTCILTSLELLDYQTGRNPERMEEHRRQIVEAARQLRSADESRKESLPMSIPETASVNPLVPTPGPSASLFESAFFGIERHELVAEVAGTLLTSQRAKQEVRRILDHLETGSLGDIAGWADRVKRREPSPSDDPETFAFLSDQRNRDNASWHFVNLPLDADGYSRTRYPKFTGSEDVVQMTNHAIRVLLGQSDRFSEANALRLLTHLVGDIHQPVHVGCCYIQEIPGPAGAQLVRDPGVAAQENLRNDQGGNRLVLSLPGSPSLHSYWDSDLGASEDHHHDAVDVTTPQLLEADAFEPPRFVAAAATRARYVAEVREAVLSSAAVLLADPQDALDPLSLAVIWAGESLVAARSAYQSLAIASRLNGGKFRVDWEGKTAYDARNAPLIRRRIESASRNLALLLDTIWP